MCLRSGRLKPVVNESQQRILCNYLQLLTTPPFSRTFYPVGSSVYFREDPNSRRENTRYRCFDLAMVKEVAHAQGTV